MAPETRHPPLQALDPDELNVLAAESHVAQNVSALLCPNAPIRERDAGHQRNRFTGPPHVVQNLGHGVFSDFVFMGLGERYAQTDDLGI